MEQERNFDFREHMKMRTNAEFFSKISIVIEEADETLFWLEVLQETGIFKPELLETLYKENEEILKIMVSARSKSKRIAENQPVG